MEILNATYKINFNSDSEILLKTSRLLLSTTKTHEKFLYDLSNYVTKSIFFERFYNDVSQFELQFELEHV